MAIDSHIHLYPPHVYHDPVAWAEARGETYWRSCVAPIKGKTLQAWKSVDELLINMDQAGIEKVAILAWYWENQDSCQENLGWQIEWVKAHPERFVAFAPFNANGGQAALDQLQLAFDVGFKGIGELNPPAQGYDYDHPLLAKALDLAAIHQAAVNFHVTDPTTHDYPGKIDTPYPTLLKLARRHANTQFVFAHLGGCEPLRNEEPIPQNVAFDTAACPLLYKVPVYRKFCDKVGIDKVLFGTDYPLRVFPRDENSPEFSAPIKELQESGLTPIELDAILKTNAERIFHLS